jgi:dTMP kinase
MTASQSLASKFIVIEGLEGAGKSTAISYVAKWFEAQSVASNAVVYTREPGGTALAEKMRDIIKMEVEGEVLQDKAELLLMYAARVQLVEHTIKPALAKGKIVVGDRHNYSSLAYQGGGRRIDLQLIKDIKQVALGDFKADFTIYLDIDPELGLNRARGRGELDRIERQAIDFFDRTRAIFCELIENDDNAISIDASQTPDLVEKSIFLELDKWLVSLR